jgi:hypothetical protein
MAGERMALATTAGIAAAVSDARTVPRTRMLGPFLIGFTIVFLHSSVAPGSAPMEENLHEAGHVNLTGHVSEISVWACYAGELWNAS